MTQSQGNGGEAVWAKENGGVTSAVRVSSSIEANAVVTSNGILTGGCSRVAVVQRGARTFIDI